MDEMSETSPEKTPALGIDWVRTIAGALAAVSTTVLLSTLGAAGTLLGAALGSIAATVATAAYSTGLSRSRARMRRLAALRTGSIPLRRDQATTEPGAAADAEAREDGDRGRWVDRLRELGWRRLAVGALAMFLVVLAIVTVFELLAGRTLASTVGGGHSGGTTISHVTGGGGGGSPHHHRPPSNAATPTEAPDSGAATPSPSSSATPSDQPSGSPSVEPSAPSTPSVQATPSETPEPTFGQTPSVPGDQESVSGQ
jgi:hypothetical protein